MTATPPSITSINYSQGDVAGGGQSIVITGTDFTGATAVTFLGTAATSYTVDSSTQITATLPAHAAGTGNVEVTTPGGSDTIAFEYWDPTDASVTATHWWRADQGVTESGGAVSQWDDLVGTMDQTASSGLEPTYSSSHASYGNKPVITSAGADYFDGVVATDTLAVPISILVIGYTASNSSYVSGSQSNPQGLLWRKSTGYVEYYNQTGIKLTTAASANSSAGATLITDAGGAGTASYLYVNNDFSTAADSDVTAYAGHTRLQLLRGSAGVGNMNGQMAEAVIWSGVLTTSDKQKLCKYIAQRYAITVTAP